MIEITKSESKKIRNKYPEVNITRTMKMQSHRHRYYLEESDKYLELIQDTNNQAAEILASHKKHHIMYY